MNKKVLALTLTAALALSPITAFAAESNCTSTAKYNFSNLKNYSCEFSNSNVKNKFTINGKTVDLNSIDCSNLFSKKTVKYNVPTTETETPADTQAEVEVPVDNSTESEATKTIENQTPAEAPAETTTTVEDNTAAETESTVTSVSAYEQKVVELVNIEREKEGLPALTLDTAISNVARIKSQDMADNNYFAHQSPTYGSAGSMLTKFGISWSAWGENIASGQKTPEAVVTAWMNSAGHRANILSSNFSKIGVGYVTNSNGTSYWTQMFTN
ncbi:MULTISPECIES: CAP domain-containing protein [unclassified Sedimentibacter]|uniref:CAP domain-containing protein n=1 Tax=unclassified Sedimentibacter TaxID=2649220 RepID=UPI0027DFC43B|nr:CAP domain-containing protein [Sedimentibacter sp. MB35-C1]WMJ78377.1 CAP domain-containing protein [Sedimentibacter sp. MB35-C1]